MTPIERQKTPGQAWKTVAADRVSSLITSPETITPIIVQTGDVTGANEDSGNISIRTGDSEQLNAGAIVLRGGQGAAEGGSIVLRPGTGTPDGSVLLEDASGGAGIQIASTGVIVGATGGVVGHYGAAGAVQQTITGALSTVTDAAAKAVLTSIIAALVATGYVTDATT